MDHATMFPPVAGTIFYVAAVLSVLTHVYVMRRARKLGARNTQPMISVMWWSQGLMALNCGVMAMMMAAPMGQVMMGLGWMVAISQVSIAVHTWQVARTLDQL